MALQDRVAAQPFIKPSFPHARVTATVALLSEANVPMSSHFRIGTSVFPPPGMLFDITPLIIQDSTLNASERMLGLLVWLCITVLCMVIFCVISYNCMGVYNYLKEKSLQNPLGLPSATDLSAMLTSAMTPPTPRHFLAPHPTSFLHSTHCFLKLLIGSLLYFLRPHKEVSSRNTESLSCSSLSPRT